MNKELKTKILDVVIYFYIASGLMIGMFFNIALVNMLCALYDILSGPAVGCFPWALIFQILLAYFYMCFFLSAALMYILIISIIKGRW